MVKHICVWKIKEEHNNTATKLAMKKALEVLPGMIPGLLELKVQIETLSSADADVMLYSVLESEEALKGYAIHPEHVRVADTFVRPFIEKGLTMDFEG